MLNTSSKVARCKIDFQSLVAFLHINSKDAENEVEGIPFTTDAKKTNKIHRNEIKQGGERSL